jgi:hypothetical protein
LSSFSANISPATLKCNASCDGQNRGYFIDDEIWMAQADRDPKSTGTSGGFWVEAGYGTWTNGGSTTSAYFWADNRSKAPCNTSSGSFVAHMLRPVSNVPVTYTITQDATNDEYDVSIVDTSGSGTVDYVPNHSTKDQISTCNPMVPREADAGLEFYGDHTYVSAGQATLDSFSIGTPIGVFVQSPADATQAGGSTSGYTQCGC